MELKPTSKEMENASLQAFLENLIDYAGLFPPAGLSLEKAIENFISYKQSEDEWMLGTFIIPASSLEEFVLNTLPIEVLSFSVTGMKSEHMEGCQTGLQHVLQQITSFQEKHGEKVQVEAVELPMPLSIPKVEDLAVLSELAQQGNVKLFCEVTIPNTEDWEQHLLETFDAFAAHNAVTNQPLGLKLRTGGLEANMFPSPEKVAAFLSGCARRKLPLKFTAGLHHPIRMYREEVQTKMYGFLNVFTAGLAAFAHQLEKEKLVEILIDEEPNHFQFQEQGLFWKDVIIEASDIQKYRKQLYSYGSCSFDEPRDELREMKFLKEASQ
ncbi:hypothetical protein [Neobacillus sp. D3-1R]|uniref:hypothetical protein n=1 Tax=Neobacillus sp. D3-1R TaxID=3445778 RepID=UPI003F9F7578